MSVTSLLEPGRKILASQPFSVLLGAQLTEFSAGRVELVVPIRDDLKQQFGFVHGGAISYAADNALTFAGGSVLGTSVITAEYKVNYLSPATGDALIARASVIHASKRQAVCRCDVFASKDGIETLCATSTGTIVKVNLPENPA
jgi:uncharacterized protein (TIGR00369 family)